MSPDDEVANTTLHHHDLLDVLRTTEDRVLFLVRDEDDLERHRTTMGATNVRREIRETELLFGVDVPSRSSSSSTTRRRRLADEDYPTIDDGCLNCYRSVDGSYQTNRRLVEQYPSLAEIVNIGPSYLKSVGRGGDDVELLKLTNRDSALPEAKKSHMFVVCSMHVRELAPAEVCARFAEGLLAERDDDADAWWILDRTVVHVILQANPDGRRDEEAQLAQGSRTYLRRKNMNFDPNTNQCSSSQGGVDLNRNWPHPAWGTVGTSYDPCSNTYPGEYAGSEPEVENIIRYVESVIPPGTNVADDVTGAYSPLNATGVFMDMHSFGEDFFYPWAYKDPVSPNQNGLAALARKMSSHTTPHYSTHNDVYDVSGDSTDWAYAELGLAAYTMELGTNFYQGCDCFESNVAPSAAGALLYAARVAERPYLYPLGPDVLKTTLFASADKTVLKVRVKASDDARAMGASTGSQSVVAVRIYVDAHPSDDGATPAASWEADDAATATASTLLAADASGLAAGRHVVYARAEDAAGAPGPTYATFFDVPLTYDDFDETSAVDDDDLVVAALRDGVGGRRRGRLSDLVRRFVVLDLVRRVATDDAPPPSPLRGPSARRRRRRRRR